MGFDYVLIVGFAVLMGLLALARSRTRNVADPSSKLRFRRTVGWFALGGGILTLILSLAARADTITIAGAVGLIVLGGWCLLVTRRDAQS